MFANGTEFAEEISELRSLCEEGREIILVTDWKLITDVPKRYPSDVFRTTYRHPHDDRLFCLPSAFFLDDCVWKFLDKSCPAAVPLLEARVLNPMICRSHPNWLRGAVWEWWNSFKFGRNIEKARQGNFGHYLLSSYLTALRVYCPGPMSRAIEDARRRRDQTSFEIGFTTPEHGCFYSWGYHYYKPLTEEANGMTTVLLHLIWRCGWALNDAKAKAFLLDNRCAFFFDSFEDVEFLQVLDRCVSRYEDRILKPFFRCLCLTRPHTRNEARLFDCLRCPTEFIGLFSLDRLASSEQYGQEASRVLGVKAALRDNVRSVAAGAVLTSNQLDALGHIFHFNVDNELASNERNPRLAALSTILLQKNCVLSTSEMTRYAEYRQSALTTAISEKDSVDLDGICVVCLTASAEFAFVPCGHKCLCTNCAKCPSLNRTQCLYCRQRTEKVIRIF